MSMNWGNLIYLIITEEPTSKQPPKIRAHFCEATERVNKAEG